MSEEEYIQQSIEYYSDLTETVKNDIFNYEAQIHWNVDRYDTVQAVQDNLEYDIIRNGTEQGDGQIEELMRYWVERLQIICNVINYRAIIKAEMQNLKIYQKTLGHYKMMSNGWEWYFRGNVRIYYLPDSDDCDE